MKTDDRSNKKEERAGAVLAPPRAFPPGWNGKARRPPLGWRSWNAFGNKINQSTMVAAMDALVASNRTIGGKAGQSLCKDVGFCSAGLDEGWEACGVGVNHTQHDAQGRPTVNTTRFPSMRAMVDHGHSLGLEVGFYENGCKCAEKIDNPVNYRGDIESLQEYGFDGVKMDDCGAQKNMTLYAEIMVASGKNFSIENHKKPEHSECGVSGDSSCPSQSWCPFNWFRSSHDINTKPESWIGNLQTTVMFLGNPPLSQPGCWAYPDVRPVPS